MSDETVETTEETTEAPADVELDDNGNVVDPATLQGAQEALEAADAETAEANDAEAPVFAHVEGGYSDLDEAGGAGGVEDADSPDEAVVEDAPTDAPAAE